MWGLDANATLIAVMAADGAQAVDTYADGTTVLDGERYALVWSKDGVFEGIDAAGEPIGEGDLVLKIEPLALNGRPRSVIFEVPKDWVDRYSLDSGVYELCLLDTRELQEGGTYALARNNYEVNAAGEPSGALTTSSLAASNGSAGDEIIVKNVAKKSTAATAAAAPDVAQPEIVGFRIDGENAFITLANLPAVVRVGGAGALDDVFVKTAETDERVVNDDGTVTITVPAAGEAGFFSVKGIK